MKRNKINWKSGNGSMIIGLVLVLGCFLLIMALVYEYSAFTASVHSQIITDVTIDGATLYAQETSTVNRSKFDTMAQRLLEENSNISGVDYEIENLDFSPVNDREHYTDTIVSLTTVGLHSNGSELRSSAKVLSRSFMANDSDSLTASETEILNYVLSELAPDNVQYKAISYIMSEGLLHKMYGGHSWEGRELISVYFPQRMGPDTYDCSGFVSSAYSTGAGIDLNITSASAVSHPYYHADLTDLQVGDIIVYPSHVSIYLGTIPDDMASRLSIAPGTVLELDSSYFGRGILIDSPAGGTGPYGTNWGIQIRRMTQTSEGVPGTGYIDMDQYNPTSTTPTPTPTPTT